ncbi:MAG: hypothetical protein JNK72_22660 [Myxococcales bacterium]|nr:hypothetical protein [Myxococcales bacterium]
MAFNPTPTATDTLDDAPAFVPERDLKSITSENLRLRRELETLQRSQRELEESTRNGDGTSRRLTLLRNALVQKDQEILSLRTHQVSRERNLQELRDLARRSERERAELEARLRDRDGVFAAIEQERARLTQALESARREREQATATLLQADQSVTGWRDAHSESLRQRDEALAALAALQASHAALGARVEALVAEKQRASEQQGREAAALRAEVKAAQEAETGLLRQEVIQLHARLEGLKEASAIARRSTDDDHAEVVANLEAELAATKAERESALGRVRALEDELKAGRGAVRDARFWMREAERWVTQRKATLVELSTHEMLWAELAARDAALAAREVEVARLQGKMLGLRHEIVDTRHELAELRAAAVRSLKIADETRAEAEVQLDQLRGEAELRIDQLRAEGDNDRAAAGELRERVEGLERELEATREALGSYAIESASRIEAAERQAADLRVYRDRYAQRLATAMREIKRISTGATAESHQLAVELKTLSGTVGRLTARLVIEAARAAAFEAGRETPLAQDVDEAITRVAEELPECVSEQLWGARGALEMRCGVTAQA